VVPQLRREANRGTPGHAPFYAGPETTIGGWKEVLAAAQQHNQPGRFTTIGLEWSGAPKAANLHRNVFFRDTNVPERPMSYIDIAGGRSGSGWRGSRSRA